MQPRSARAFARSRARPRQVLSWAVVAVLAEERFAARHSRGLLNAKSVVYNADGVTAKHIAKIFERLGIAEQMKAKTKPLRAGRAGTALSSRWPLARPSSAFWSAA